MAYRIDGFFAVRVEVESGTKRSRDWDTPAGGLHHWLVAFKIRSTESTVLQLRVVAEAPKSPSIWPRKAIVRIRRRYTPKRSRSFEPMIWTNGSPLFGMEIGSEGLWRLAFDRMLTNGTISLLGGSSPNGFSSSNRERSLSSQKVISASKGSFRRNSARNFVREPGLRTIKVPAAPTFTTS